MATALDLQLTEPIITARPSGPGSWPRAAWRFCRRKPLGAIGGFIVIAPIVLRIYSISVFASRSGAYVRMFWIIIIVGAIISFGSARVVRGAAISAANNQYVDAARTIGAGHMRIVFRHIVPNVIPVIIVLATVNIGSAILAEAAISFLGYGIPPPFPSLGGMLNISGSSQFRAHPLEAVWPGLAIALGVYGFNMFGAARRAVLDPRLRGSR